MSHRKPTLISPADLNTFVAAKAPAASPDVWKIDPLSTLALVSPQIHARAAKERWSTKRALTALEQLTIVHTLQSTTHLGEIDGLAGPRTDYALELYQNHMRDVITVTSTSPLPNLSAATTLTGSQAPTPTIVFPTYANARSFFGQPGSPACQARVKSLYPLRMDGSRSATASIATSTVAKDPKHYGVPILNSIALHENLHESFRLVQQDILAHYGIAKIMSLGLDQYAGSYNHRPMRGGTKLSTHSWGAAIDWDAQRNTLRETSRTARFATEPYRAFLDIWEAHGWISLGRQRNFDWMHVQAMRL